MIDLLYVMTGIQLFEFLLLFGIVLSVYSILHTAKQDSDCNSGSNQGLSLFLSAMAVESFTAVSPNVQVGSFVLSKGKDCFLLALCLLLHQQGTLVFFTVVVISEKPGSKFAVPS